MTVTVFAHYDSEGLISEYVKEYILEIKKSSQKLIFVSDSILTPEAYEEVSKIADKVISLRHGEYDFGSYKLGWEYALKEGWLNNAEGLIFANDSCYCIQSLQPIIEGINQKDCDFWGMTSSNLGMGTKISFKDYKTRVRKYVGLKKYIFLNLSYKNNIKNLYLKFSYDKKEYHIQSYFVYLKANVINSYIFKNFMQSIEKQDNKADIIRKYECGLSQKLIKAGFKPIAFFGDSEGVDNISITLWDYLIMSGFPLLKTSIIRWKNQNIAFLALGWQKLLKEYTDCPISYIENDILKNRDNLNFKKIKSYFFKGIKKRNIAKKQYNASRSNTK